MGDLLFFVICPNSHRKGSFRRNCRKSSIFHLACFIENFSIIWYFITYWQAVSGKAGDGVSKDKLMIVDNCEDFPLALAEVLKNDYEVQYCLDGKEALSMLRTFQPKVLLLELMIPSLDGISLLETAAAEGMHPHVLTFSRYYNEYTMAALAKLNVRYCMIKPCDLHATADRIKDLKPLDNQEAPLSQDPRESARDLLFSLGFVTKHHGYAYLLEALVMVAQTPDQSITKHLYPNIGAKFNCVRANVEHAIRTAIKVAWAKRDDAVWKQYFLPSADGNIARPTNAVFISRLSQELRNSK
jgi:two-component system response regulator (stage 0 sporulation protein A)